jgi:tetratricopeptide (TPR) repeat protein
MPKEQHILSKEAPPLPPKRRHTNTLISSTEQTKLSGNSETNPFKDPNRKPPPPPPRRRHTNTLISSTEKTKLPGSSETNPFIDPKSDSYADSTASYASSTPENTNPLNPFEDENTQPKPEIIFQQGPPQEASQPEPRQIAEEAWKQGSEAFKNKEYAEALTKFKEAYQNEPDRGKKEEIRTIAASAFATEGIKANKGLKFIKSKNKYREETSLNMHEMAHELDPENPVHLANIGNSLYHLSNYTEAENFYTLALEHTGDPKQIEKLKKSIRQARRQERAKNVEDKLNPFKKKGWEEI